MAPLQARRSERIDYKAEVELLTPVGATHAPHRVLAHAVDLGSGGMRISAPVDMPIGAQVTCRVMLDGRPASLPGRVAWRSDVDAHGPTDLHGMGICFEPLGTYESGLLKHVVERSNAGYRAVALHFPGLAEPVVARARARSNGLQLSAALPIFARNTELSFQLDEEGPVFTGRIGEAVLQEDADGARSIAIEVDVIEPEETGRYRRRARYGYAVELEAEQNGAPQLQSTAPMRDRHTSGAGERTVQRATAGKRGRWLRTLGAAAAGGTLAWFAAAALQQRAAEPDMRSEFVAHPLAAEAAAAAANADPRPDIRLPERNTPVPEPVSTVSITAAEPEPDPLPFGTADVAGPASVRTPVPPNALGRARPKDASKGAEPSAAPSPSAIEHTSDGVEPIAAPILGGAAPALGGTASSGDSAPAITTDAPGAQPETVLEPDATRVRLPFEGSLDGMRAVVWSEPLALAIDIPHGSSALQEGTYPVGAGGITDLRVNKRDDALLIRVRLSSPIARYAITAVNGTLEARLVPAANTAH